MASCRAISLRICVVLGLLSGVGATRPASTPPGVGESATAYFPAEVRLRKLHLVRPDLIPYPIALEVVC